ncbi:uncharacterized protein LOC143526493 [Brachyhypopomus gauderio]|uniref:uncharacterized protein LOC143526493 n=1 Tax=Brachyhypopomus gauderio TaxID=698409 RepID=UPI004041AAA7
MDNCSFPGNSNREILIPVLTCVCQALIMSISVNVYLICTSHQRTVGQRLYNSVVHCCHTRREQQPAEQVQDENDVQYCAVKFSSWRELGKENEETEDRRQETEDRRQKTEKAEPETEDRRQETEGHKEDTTYSDVASFGWE